MSEECSGLCLCDSECNFWVFDSEDSICVLTEDCHIIDTGCDTCVSGGRGCGKLTKPKTINERLHREDIHTESCHPFFS